MLEFGHAPVSDVDEVVHDAKAFGGDAGLLQGAASLHRCIADVLHDTAAMQRCNDAEENGTDDAVTPPSVSPASASLCYTQTLDAQ